MKGAVFHGPGGSWPEKPMTIEDVPMPEVGTGDVLVKVAACGLCRTDLEYLRGELPLPKSPPIILGHEPSGIVEEVGKSVKNVKKGDRVLMPFTITCGQCFWCRTGNENLCANAQVIGAHRDGALAEYISVPSKIVYPLPPEIPLEEGAVIADAIATPLHAVVDIAEVKPGDSVAVYGASGGLGLAVVQIASALGAVVIGVGRKAWKLEKAKEFGASHTINISSNDKPYEEIKSMTGEGTDIAIDATGIPQMIEWACRSIRPGGKVVVVGFSTQKITIAINRLLWFEQKILGARTYRPVDIYRAVEMARRGIVNLKEFVSHKFSLQEVNRGYEMLANGEILRGVVLPGS